MKELNGIDIRAGFNPMCPHEERLTGIVTEDVIENEKNTIFNMIRKKFITFII